MNMSVKNFPGSGLSGAASAASLRLPQDKTVLGGGENEASDLMHSGPMKSLSNLGGILDGEHRQAQGGLARAAGAINEYMQSTGMNTMNTDQLKQLATGTSPTGIGQVPDKVAEAAAFLLAGPKNADGESRRWSQVETADVAGDDGLSSRGNFARIAQGGQAAAPTQGHGLLQDGGIPRDFMKALSELAEQESEIRQAMEQTLMSAIGHMLSTLQSIAGGGPGAGQGVAGQAHGVERAGADHDGGGVASRTALEL
jgi:hypothetical protein